MRCHLLFSVSASLLLAWLCGCGGNVTVGAGGAGGGSTSSTTSTPSSTSSGNGSGSGTVPGEFAACSAPGECTLVRAGCCDPCGTPELTDFAAVNIGQADAYEAFVCPEQPPCDKCATGSNPHLFAYCDTAAGKCIAADARTHAVSACADDAQCYLRGGTSCCESCGELDTSDLTALSSTAAPSLLDLVCAEGFACPPCAPVLPGEVLAICGAGGHCQVFVIDK